MYIVKTKIKFATRVPCILRLHTMHSIMVPFEGVLGAMCIVLSLSHFPLPQMHQQKYLLEAGIGAAAAAINEC